MLQIIIINSLDVILQDFVLQIIIINTLDVILQDFVLQIIIINTLDVILQDFVLQIIYSKTVKLGKPSSKYYYIVNTCNNFVCLSVLAAYDIYSDGH